MRLEHWHPQLVRGEAAFRSLLTTFSRGEQEARARVARKTFNAEFKRCWERANKTYEGVHGCTCEAGAEWTLI